jgi:hypothetical protein
MEGVVTYSDSFNQIYASYLCFSLTEKKEFLISSNRYSYALLLEKQTHLTATIIDVGTNTTVNIHPQTEFL